VAALILARGAAIRSLAPDERLRWVSGVLMAAREGKGEAGKRAAAMTQLASKRGRVMIDWREGGLAVVRVEEYNTHFLQEKKIVHIVVHIKCISICSTYEKFSKKKSCIGCIAWYDILYFSKILEEPRRI
jgi:hypothetical protein